MPVKTISFPIRVFLRFFLAAAGSFLLAVPGDVPPSGDTLILDIPSTPENPRNSEGSFVTLRSGRILFAYTQFYKGGSDESPARIVSVHSDDGGRSWSKPPQVLVENRAGRNMMSVSLLRLKSGRIALFYLIKNSWLDCRPWLQISENEGQTWSPPKLATESPGYFVLNNDRVAQLGSGRLVMPLAFHRSRSADPQDRRTFDSRAIAMWYLSDDEGQTWRESADWWGPPLPNRSGLQEPGVVELADGGLFSWARTDLGSQYLFLSSDSGISWTPPVASSLQSPLSPASIKRLPDSADLLAVYNDHSGRYPFPAGRRTPLVAAISRDNGKTWETLRMIEEDPAGSYCYTAIHFVKDAVLLGYIDFRASKKDPLGNRLRLRKIPLDWLIHP